MTRSGLFSSVVIITVHCFLVACSVQDFATKGVGPSILLALGVSDLWENKEDNPLEDVRFLQFLDPAVSHFCDSNSTPYSNDCNNSLF